LDTTITTLLNYKDRNTHNVIQALKYDASRDAVHLCSTVLADFLAEEIATLRTFSDRSIMLVPIPLHPERTRTRGFNQIEKVLRGLPKEYRDGTMSSVQPLLVRTRDTPHQTHLPRNERLKNVDGAFALRKDISIKHAHIILIDDVTTTGATLTCAGTPFRRSGATITLLALARA
jgi:ComF family protein